MGTITYSNYVDNQNLKVINKNLTNQIEQLKDDEIKVTDIYYEQIKEINKDKVNLNIFDSDYSTYETTTQETNKINPLETTVKLKWKYKVGLDMTGIQMTKTDNYIRFNIDKSLITITDLIVDIPQVNSNTNFLNQFAGKRIEDINNKSIKLAYSSIKDISKDDFEKRYDGIVKNIEAKLSYLYGIESKYIKVSVMK